MTFLSTLKKQASTAGDVLNSKGDILTRTASVLARLAVGSNGKVLTGKFGSIGLDDRDMVISGDPNKLMGGNSSGTPSKMEFGNLNITGRIEVVSPDGSANGMDMSSLKPQIEKMIISHMNGSFRDGGVTSSKQATDYMGQS